MITLYTNNERPAWVSTISENGELTDYSTGYTFTCVVVDKDTGSTLLTKTTNITGAANGVITVSFTGAELSAAGITATFGNPVHYQVFLTSRRTSDSADATHEDVLQMRWRP